MYSQLKKLLKLLPILAGGAVGVLIGYLLFQPGGVTEPSAQVSTTEDETWTCSMHPQIQMPEPGRCPLCGMDLIPAGTDQIGTDSATLELSESAKALASIQTTLVERGEAVRELRLFGKVSYDETRLRSISARFPARIEKLFVNAIGIQVQQGDHLALVYSQELLAAQSDLVSSLKFRVASDATQGPREQLRQWGFSEADIESIINSLSVREFLEIDAPIGGTVVGKSIQEGDHVEMGANFFTIADLTHVWITLDVYESDLSWVHYGQEISIHPEASPGRKFLGKVSLIYPEIDPMTRTAKVRVSLPNPERILKPGQFVRGVLKASLNAEGEVIPADLTGQWISPMHPEVIKDGPGYCDVCGMELVPAREMGLVASTPATQPLLVPSSAVLRTGKRAVVYVEERQDGHLHFTGREIELGVRTEDHFVVLSGLEGGERVVSNGAFKIDSALQIQAKPSMMNPSDPVSVDPGWVIPVELGPQILGPYLKLQSALSGDDLKAAAEQVEAISELAGGFGPLPALFGEMGEADSLDGIRRPFFDQLSAAMIAAVHSDPTRYDGDLWLMHCPMVYADRGADWLQSTDSLLNPYFGASMLTCGEVKERLTSQLDHGP